MTCPIQWLDSLWVIPSKYNNIFSLSSLPLFLLVWQAVSNIMSCSANDSHIPLSFWLYSLWVISCHLQLYLFSPSSHSYFDSIGLIGSEWFQVRCSYIPSYYCYSILGFIGLIGSEWFYTMLSCVSSTHCPYSHSGSVGLIASRWFYARPAVSLLTVLTLTLGLLWWQAVSHFMLGPGMVLFTGCSHSHSGPVGLIASEWFHANSHWMFSQCLPTVLLVNSGWSRSVVLYHV